MIALNHEDSYEYFIDAEDRIVSVDSNWLSFARENQASTLTAETVVGEPLFRFITDQETRHIYQLILEKVRSPCEKVIIPFRCDGPRVRRFMELQISQEGGLVKFVGRTVSEE